MRLILFLVALWLNPIAGDMHPAMAADNQPAPGVNERLNDFLGTEGGVQVYKDDSGNVGTIIDPPGGERRTTVQPPQSPSMNLGPPLQLHDPRGQEFQESGSGSASPPEPDFPRKAR